VAIIERYTRAAIMLHWVVAALIILNVALALSIDFWPEGWSHRALDTHKSIGITVLGLALLRLLWRATHRPPPLPLSYSRWERLGAQSAHAGLYLLIFAMPLSGWLFDSAWKDAAGNPLRLFGLFPWPRIGFIMSLPPDVKEPLHNVFGAAHAAFSYLLYLLLTLHVLGALKHQWIDREPELQRMWPGADATNVSLFGRSHDQP
jgi:cytochrome b561